MAGEWVDIYIGHDLEKAESTGTYLRVYGPCSLAQRTECMSGNGLPLPADITAAGGRIYIAFWEMLRDGVRDRANELRSCSCVTT